MTEDVNVWIAQCCEITLGLIFGLYVKPNGTSREQDLKIAANPATCRLRRAGSDSFRSSGGQSRAWRDFESATFTFAISAPLSFQRSLVDSAGDL